MLSDTKVRKALPGERDYKLADEKGLFLLVRPSGGKLWRMKYRYHGSEKLLSFGPYPDVTLADARDKRDAARKLLVADVDPGVEKKRQAFASRVSAANAFEPIARAWYERERGRWASVHASDVLRSLERDVFPTLGKVPLTEIDAPMVLDLLRKIERRGAIETAKRLRQRISAIYVYALAERLARENPAAGIEGALAHKPKARRQPAVVDLVELRALLRKAEESGASPITLYASRLLALTAVRPGVVRGARWDEIQGIDWIPESGGDYADTMQAPIWHIPAERMKLTLDRKDETGFDHIVPLAPAAVDVLRSVRRLSGRGDLVFPGGRHAHIPLSENAIGYLYNRVGWHGRHVPHGWRAAFSTIMNERAKAAGRDGDRQVIDLMLAHVPSNKVESAYNRGEFMPRRREIAEEWAGLLTEGLLPAADLLTVARRTANP